MRINITVTDRDEVWTTWIAHGIPKARPAHETDVQLTVVGPKVAPVGLLLEPSNREAILGSGAITTEGDLKALDASAGVMEDFDPAISLVAP